MPFRVEVFVHSSLHTHRNSRSCTLVSLIVLYIYIYVYIHARMHAQNKFDSVTFYDSRTYFYLVLTLVQQ